MLCWQKSVDEPDDITGSVAEIRKLHELSGTDEKKRGKFLANYSGGTIFPPLA
jgi:hypothetical protein